MKVRQIIPSILTEITRRGILKGLGYTAGAAVGVPLATSLGVVGYQTYQQKERVSPNNFNMLRKIRGGQVGVRKDIKPDFQSFTGFDKKTAQWGPFLVSNFVVFLDQPIKTERGEAILIEVSLSYSIKYNRFMQYGNGTYFDRQYVYSKNGDEVGGYHYGGDDFSSLFDVKELINIAAKYMKQYIPSSYEQEASPEKKTYSDKEMAEMAARERNFDIERARKAGYSDKEILDFLAPSNK